MSINQPVPVNMFFFFFFNHHWLFEGFRSLIFKSYLPWYPNLLTTCLFSSILFLDRSNSYSVTRPRHAPCLLCWLSKDDRLLKYEFLLWRSINKGCHIGKKKENWELNPDIWLMLSSDRIFIFTLVAIGQCSWPTVWPTCNGKWISL